MIANPKPRANLADLYKEPGKAELVNGELVRLMPTGNEPGYAGDAILVSLWQYAKERKNGIAVGDNKAFSVNLPHRESFSPNAAYHTGPRSGMKFFVGAPIFAVEVHSEGDYGRAAERDLAAKRFDYFRTGTLVVWDVDLQSTSIINKYTSDSPDLPVIFGRGEIADAEPAVPNWKFSVDDLFET